jgi:hypothetical protein
MDVVSAPNDALEEVTGIEHSKILDYVLTQSPTAFGCLMWAAGLDEGFNQINRDQVLLQFVDRGGVDSLCSRFHATAFFSWLATPLSQQRRDFSRYLTSTGQIDDAALVGLWRDPRRCARLIPNTARPHERDLFMGDFQRMVESIQHELGDRPATVMPHKTQSSTSVWAKLSASLGLRGNRAA